MKLQTKISDLTTLLASTDATTKAAHDAERLASAIASANRESAISALDISLASRAAATKAAGLFAKIPLPRRGLARVTMTKAERLGKAAAALGERYSGATDYSAGWAASPSASTYTSKGAQYSGRCTYKKTDASHVVNLSPEWAVLLTEREDVAALSARDGLPLIGWHADGRACWVKTKGKAITSEIGYISHFGTVCYHSTKSQQSADQGLKIKLAAMRDEWEAQAVARANAAQWAKDERRARLIARLCDVSATIADAREMGYCTPGIEAFQSQHHIGDSAPLRALLSTGNAAAVRLALAVARKVRRAEAVAA